MQRPRRIHQLLPAVPVEVAGKVVQPVARVDGWHSGRGQPGAGTWVSLTPASVTVREGERSYGVPLVVPTQSALRPLFMVGVVVMLTSLFIMWLTTSLTHRW